MYPGVLYLSSTAGTAQQKKLLDIPPIQSPKDYLTWVNVEESSEEVETIRRSVNKGVPYGREQWVGRMVIAHHLETTQRIAGRPKKH